MAFLLKDRVLESATGSGTGNLTLGGAVSEYSSFSSAGYANGDTFPGYIKGAAGTGEWQAAILTYNTGGTVSRTTPLDGSSGQGVAVNFTAGAKEIGVSLPASLVGWQQIGATVNTTSGSSVSFTSIPATYSDLMLVFEGVSHDSGSNQALRIELSGNDGGTWTAPLNISGTNAASVAVFGAPLIPGYRKGTGSIRADNVSLTADTSAASGSGNSVVWRIAAGINAIRISPAAGSFDAGSIKLFGRL